mgnify:CR=1 FL=1|tara:strand:+ start:56 stop:871 length:816 start_codon:yes stop_codon:yes gene_type:complete
MQDREEFLEELKLREYIRKAIRIVEQKKAKAKEQEQLNEQKLRSFVRELLKKELLTEKEAVADSPPHSSTGINVLEDLLKKIVPVLETDFKVLTSEPEQRKSFRAHVIHAVKNALAPARASAEDEVEAAGAPPAEPLAEADINVDVDEEGEGAAFIDIGGYGPEETEEEEDTFSIEGEDETGRNVAQKSFDKIEQNILDSYEVLAREEDKTVFYDYLLTNLKLYFDKFEDELRSNLTEPTTPEYEQEKTQQDTEDVGGAEAAGDLGGELEL